MVDNKFIAWTAFTLFVLALAIAAALVFSPILERFDLISPQAALWVMGALALMATGTGFVAFKTPQGKVAAVGGLLLLLAILFVTPIRSVVDAS
jgi:hypothetical protein